MSAVGDHGSPGQAAGRPARPCWGLIWIGVAVAIYLFAGSPFEHPQRAELSYTDFQHQVEADNVAMVHVRGQEIDGRFRRPYTPPPPKSASAPSNSTKGEEKPSLPAYDSFRLQGVRDALRAGTERLAAWSLEVSAFEAIAAEQQLSQALPDASAEVS